MVFAKQGYPIAEFQVGYFYYNDIGVEKNIGKAVYWTRKAAENGARDGQYNLAWFYENGVGIKHDKKQSIL